MQIRVSASGVADILARLYKFLACLEGEMNSGHCLDGR